MANAIQGGIPQTGFDPTAAEDLNPSPPSPTAPTQKDKVTVGSWDAPTNHTLPWEEPEIDPPKAWGFIIDDPFGGLPTLGDFGSAIGKAWDKGVDYWNTGVDIISTIPGMAAKGLQKGWSALKDYAAQGWQGAKNVAADTWGGISDTVSDAWGGVKDTASDVWDGIKDTFGYGDKQDEPGENNGASGGQVSGADDGVGQNDLPDSF